MDKKFSQTESVLAGRRLSRRYLGAALAAGIALLALSGCGVEDAVKASTPTYSLMTFASPPKGGTVSRSPDQSSYYGNTDVTVTATAKDGYTFTGWSGATESTDLTVTITMNADKALIAAFEKINTGGDPVTPAYTLTVVPSPTNGGTVSRNPNKDAYDAGTQVTVTATAAAGYVFTGWAEASSAKTSPVTITMDKSKVLIANFEKQADVPKTYTLTVNASPTAGGSVSRNPSANVYNAGETVSVSATAAAGYTFSGWSGASTSTTSPVTITMDGNKTLVANFTQNVPATPTGWWMFDDFNGEENSLGLAPIIFTWGNLSINALTSVKDQSGFEYGPTATKGEYGWGGPLSSNPMKCGRSGAANDYCAGVEYADVLDQTDLAPYPGFGIGTYFSFDATMTNSALKNVQKISFWAKGTPGVTVIFHLQDNKDGQSPYSVSLTNITEGWKQYEFSITPVSYNGCNTTASTSNAKAGDFVLANWVASGRCHKFEAEKIVSLQWNIDVNPTTGPNSGHFYLDDVQLYYAP